MPSLLAEAADFDLLVGLCFLVEHFDRVLFEAVCDLGRITLVICALSALFPLLLSVSVFESHCRVLFLIVTECGQLRRSERILN